MVIPTNLITGFLGVGKTTAVIDLLKRKERGSRWAVLVNEYGDVAIDGAMIAGDSPDGVTVREVGGGCVCCASAPYLPVALHFLLLDAKPERLIIETTGLGHPARLLDTLRLNYRDRLDLRAAIGLVDPADFAKQEMRDNPVFVEQIEMADVLVMNKLDLATPELVAEFQVWANDLFPPKLLVAGTTHGRLDPAWLDLGSLGSGVGNQWSGLLADDTRLPTTDSRPLTPDSRLPTPDSQLPSPGRPSRYPSPPGVRPACCGWIFAADDVFDEGKLLAFLGGVKGVTRLKGVFHLPDEWAAVNRVGTAVTVTPTAYRRDSRVEVFSDVVDWPAFEQRLLDCLIVSPARVPS